jgi:hypothetical protein
MSKRINVNPGQYKVAGRERMGENLTQERDRHALGKSKSELDRRASRRPKSRVAVKARDGRRSK